MAAGAGSGSESDSGTGTATMSEPELLLDSNIRLWVVLPIVFITFFVGMIRHYVSILLQSDKRLTQEQVSPSLPTERTRGRARNLRLSATSSFIPAKRREVEAKRTADCRSSGCESARLPRRSWSTSRTWTRSSSCRPGCKAAPTSSRCSDP